MSPPPPEEHARLDYQPLQADDGTSRFKIAHTPDWKRLYWATVGIVGTGVAWAVHNTYCTPTFRELGLGDAVINYVWVAGPLIGIILQPLVGVYTDHSTSRWGRRRPAMLNGAIMTAIGLEVFCNAEWIGRWFGDTDNSHPVGIGIAMVSLWVTLGALYVMQAPQRALLSDLFPDSSLPLANGLAAMHLGLGFTIGYIMGAFDLASWPVLSWLGTNIRAIYTLAAVVILVCVSSTCATTHEQRHSLPEGERPPKPKEVLTTIFRGVATLPESIRRAFVVQVFGFAAWCFVWLYASEWMAEVVFGGSADSDDATFHDYERGVMVASLGSALMTGVSMVWSLCVPQLCSRFSSRVVWACCLGVFSVLLLCTLVVQETAAAVALLGLMGIPWAATQSIPWAIVTQEISRSNSDGGLVTALFNLSQATTEAFVAIVGGSIYSCFGTVAADLGVGGVSAFVAMCLCYFLLDPGKPKRQAKGGRRPSVPLAVGEQELVSPQLTLSLLSDSRTYSVASA